MADGAGCGATEALPAGSAAGDPSLSWEDVRGALPPRALRRVGALAVVGLAVLGVWGARYQDSLRELPPVDPAPFALGLLSLAMVVGLQAVRTSLLFPRVPRPAVLLPVLAGHVLNLLLAVAGDAVELLLLTRLSGVAPTELLRRALVRALATAGTAVLSIGVVLGGLPLLIGAVSLVVVMGLSLTKAPLGLGMPPRRALGHATAAVVQQACAAVALWAMLTAAGGEPTWHEAALGGGAVDLLAYIPVPLGGVGVHHATIGFTVSDGAGHAWGAVLHHGATLGVGLALLAAVASSVARRP